MVDFDFTHDHKIKLAKEIVMLPLKAVRYERVMFYNVLSLCATHIMLLFTGIITVFISINYNTISIIFKEKKLTN